MHGNGPKKEQTKKTNRKNIAKNRVTVRRSESQEPRVFCEVSLGDFMMPKKRLSKLSFSVYDDFVIFCSRCYIFYALHICTSIFDFFFSQARTSAKQWQTTNVEQAESFIVFYGFMAEPMTSLLVQVLGAEEAFQVFPNYFLWPSFLLSASLRFGFRFRVSEDLSTINLAFSTCK